MAKKAPATKRGGLTAEMPIAVVHGPEPFLLGERTAELLAALKEKHGEIEPIVFDGRTATLAAVLDELRSYGLMQQHKLVIVDPVDEFLKSGEEEEDQQAPPGMLSNREGMERYAANPVDHATLLLRGPTWRRSKLDKLIEQAGGALIKIAEVSTSDAIKWSIDRGKHEYRVAVEPDAAELLVYRIGSQLGRLDTEIGKLANAVEAGRPIDRSLVAAMTPMSREEQAWVIQESIVTGSAQAMLRKISELMQLASRDENVAIPVAWAFNDLLRKIYAASKLLRQGAKEFVVTKELKLWGPSTQPILALAKSNEPAAIAQLLRHAIRTDQHNKSGRGDPRRNLETLCVRVADTFAPRTAVRSAR